jgi:threonine aldolase/ribosomal protein S18 acetylase RimI-like enzyme
MLRAGLIASGPFAGSAGLCDRFSVQVRERTEADLEGCERLTRVVHGRDGYPRFLPADLRGFIATPDAIGAWVAEQDGEIIGHVALRPTSSPPVMDLASRALGRSPDSLGVVARLVVSPRHRRRGLGRSLLELASNDARARGLWPVLDVVVSDEGAIALYESCGWSRAGKVTVRWPNYPEVEEFVYLGPRVPPTDTTAEEERELARVCTRFVEGHGRRTAAAMLSEIALDTEVDHYGEGGVVAELETEVAGLLAKEAAVFLVTGTMAQQVALRVHAERRGRWSFVAHPACHLDWREGRGYQRLHGLSLHQVGELRRPLGEADLDAVAEAPAALVLELPQRDLGGHLPAWDDLEAQVAWARRCGAAAHLDGARLWEAAAGYGRPPAEVAALFDTVYVSFYKGLGAIGGCCVAGPADVVAEIREWRTRHGGTVCGLWPYAASCLAALKTRLSRMGEYHRHALAIAEVLASLPGVEVVPYPPPTSHMHVLLHRDGGELRAAALDLAKQRQIWTFSRFAITDSPSVQRVELPVGDATLTFSPEEIGELVGYLLKD